MKLIIINIVLIVLMISISITKSAKISVFADPSSRQRGDLRYFGLETLCKRKCILHALILKKMPIDKCNSKCLANPCQTYYCELQSYFTKPEAIKRCFEEKCVDDKKEKNDWGEIHVVVDDKEVKPKLRGKTLVRKSSKEVSQEWKRVMELKDPKIRDQEIMKKYSDLSISYNGGDILHGKINLYCIWYGKWENKAKDLILNFMKNVGKSKMFNIIKRYKDSKGNKPTEINFKNSIDDNLYSQGKHLSYSKILLLIQTAIKSKKLPKDQKGIYFVFTSPDVTEGEKGKGFCDLYCGWHKSRLIENENINFVFVGSPRSFKCPLCKPIELFSDGNSALIKKLEASPQHIQAAHGMVNFIAHELIETITDPNFDAWYGDLDGEIVEVADICNRPKVKYSTVVGTESYVIQPLYLPYKVKNIDPQCIDADKILS